MGAMEPSSGNGSRPQYSGPDAGTDVDVLVVGAGVTGIYQLYRALDAGFSALLLEAGDGPGGVWHWNRYPEARLDSESFTYGYFFSRELFDDWRWQELYAGQPENERYFGYVVDRCDLRPHIRFGTRVDSAVLDEDGAAWTVRAGDDLQVRARFLVAATGVLSIPIYPPVAGREDFRGEAHHTGLWPKEPVDFTGKQVAVFGTGSSGVQVIPAIADDVASLTVYQRTPNWATPLNNAPISGEEHAGIQAAFERIRDTCATSASGFMHVPHDRTTFEDGEGERRAFYEKMWNSGGFRKLTSNYTDLVTDPRANAEWCVFMAEKIRGIVQDPATAEKLIPDHPYAAKRPPFVTGYYEAFNKPNVELVSLKQNPVVRVTETGVETTDGHREFDIIVWASGFDFGTGALNRMGIRGRDGLPLEKHWEDGPVTFLGIQTRGFPNLFFPGGPHGAAGNNPRYASDQVDFVTDLLEHMRAHGYDSVEVEETAEQEWTAMVDTYAERGPFKDISYFFGSNVPGKPRRYLLNPAGRPKMREVMTDVVANGYRAYALRSSRSAGSAAPA